MRQDRATLPVGGSPRLQIMGPLRLWRGDVELDAGPRQQRCLLALLAAQAGRPVSFPHLVELLWDQESPASAVNAIHKYAGRLRRLLEPDLPPRASGSYLLRHGDGYQFMADAETLDLAAFRQSVAAAESSLGRGDEDLALHHYIAALGHCQGPAGDILADSTGAAATFARIDGEFLDAVMAAAEVALRAGQPSQLLAPLRLAARIGPLNEPVHASLMTALAAAGQQAEALAVFDAVRTSLAEGLGIDPGTALQAARQRVLCQAVPPTAPRSNCEAEGPPRQTLLMPPAQLPPDLPVFAGRDTELAALEGLVAQAGGTGPLVVAMHGIGGVGKSTLATHFAHLVADQFPDGQLYVNFQEPGDDETVSDDDALRSLLHGIGVGVPDMPATSEARTGTYRSLTAGKRILVLLDNVPEATQVRSLLPSSALSLVLVTGRSPLVGLAALNGAYLLPVELPSLPMARELLKRRLTRLATRRADDGYRETIDEMIESCGRLPLTLATLAGRAAARPEQSLAGITAELRGAHSRLAPFPDDWGTFAPQAPSASPGSPPSPAFSVSQPGAVTLCGARETVSVRRPASSEDRFRDNGAV